jgi:hypothetical protein
VGTYRLIADLAMLVVVVAAYQAMANDLVGTGYGTRHREVRADRPAPRGSVPRSALAANAHRQGSDDGEDGSRRRPAVRV